MKKHEYFMTAIKHGLHHRRAWLITLFSEFVEPEDSWTADPYPYRLVSNRFGVFFVNESGKIERIEDAKPHQPLLEVKARFVAPTGSLPNIKQDTDTNYGIFIANAVVLTWPFGDKIDYMTGRWSLSQVESIIVGRLEDIPPPDAERDPSKIYVDEYIKFADAAFFLSCMTQVVCPAATPKTMTAPPGVVKYRNQLLKENADQLHDPAVVAKIMQKLIEFDSEYLKGDPGEGFLIDPKTRKVSRSKLFLMGGLEQGFNPKAAPTLLENSLEEGWDPETFPALNNSSRNGSYKRGRETMLGGEAVKWLLRASSNINITVDDCESKLGMSVVMTESIEKNYLGFHIVGKDGRAILLDTSNISQYRDTEVMVRSPMFCKLDKTDYCKCCVGPRLAATPTAASSAITSYGSTFMLIMMKAMHGKELAVQRLDWLAAFQ